MILQFRHTNKPYKFRSLDEISNKVWLKAIRTAYYKLRGLGYNDTVI